ncbi:MAG: CDP-alcohol phosphatidyltransferase family protein [Candidatus Helarchaeota archaeon]
MTAFDLFHLLYLITIVVITAVFVVHAILTRKNFDLHNITFNEYFKFWLEHHGIDTPPEEVRGPLKPYLHAFFIAGKGYARLGMTANKLTTLGLVWALWALECWFLGGNWILVGVLFVILSGSTDSLDGVVALITGTASKFGAWYDAVLDKFGDILWIAGPLFFIFTDPIALGAYDPIWLITVAVVGLLALLLALIQEYCRARAQSLGIEVTIPTIGERISRLGFIIVITACIGFSNVFTFFTPTPDFQNVNNFMHTSIIPICFFGLLIFAILSIIQLTKHTRKHLLETAAPPAPTTPSNN